MVIKKLPRGLKTTVNIPFEEEPPNIVIMPRPEPPNIDMKFNEEPPNVSMHFEPEPTNVQIVPDVEDDLVHSRHPRKRLA